MAERRFLDNVSRRKVLQILAGSVGSTAGPLLPGVGAGTSQTHSLVEIDEKAAPYSPKFFTSLQMQLLAELAEIIIPTDDHSPGAKAARVHEYIDEVVADTHSEEKDLWTKGLAAVEAIAQRDHGKGFLQLTPEQQLALMETISRNEQHPRRLEERFFKALKDTTVKGYYTSAVGIHQDLQYVGNTYLDEFPGCTHPEHQGKPETPHER